ncbi:aldehyde dehydrogenase [Reticulomyxa filosa]|uniref:Aldehyde dehydrogenase n=1 Tax=Reticulomyxa filosa TaxID=46433 RepID=X6NYN9_RETFI|nr:aldehyde dehydrogenase [Reticulomyxa filosa]|eukprot:ETO30377.1 aldehyde dehydrogenase [Reticulomyxa filosa]
MNQKHKFLLLLKKKKKKKGNNVIVKPCNTVPTVSKLMGDLLHKYMSPYFVQVIGTPDGIPDDRECTHQILQNKFDLIFFTGSTNGGRYVMSQAAKFLTPVILELGGKNPVIVDSTANLALAAKQIMYARVINCGQQCISPDYILCEKKAVDELTEQFCTLCVYIDVMSLNVANRLKLYAEKFFSEDYVEDTNQCKLVNDVQFERVKNMLDSSKGKVISGGKCDSKTRKFQPTIVRCDLSDPGLEQETFGPIVWVVSVDDIKIAVEYINRYALEIQKKKKKTKTKKNLLFVIPSF